jgi:hypothetical protein
MSDKFYREECDRDFGSLAIGDEQQGLAGFRAKCHPLTSFQFEVPPGWLVLRCPECREVVMRFRVLRMMSPKTGSCACENSSLVDVGYRNGVVVLLCATCHLTVVGAEVAPHSVDADGEPPYEEAPAKPVKEWVN